jgi:hypothetical protein
MYWKKMKHYDGHVFLMSKKVIAEEMGVQLIICRRAINPVNSVIDANSLVITTNAFYLNEKICIQKI